MPKGEGWHKELIVLSCSPPEGKAAIFSQSIVEKLHQYRNFRHRFVSGYGFQLKGEKMLELAVFGDVPVDLLECRKRDGIAIGIDGDEYNTPQKLGA